MTVPRGSTRSDFGGSITLFHDPKGVFMTTEGHIAALERRHKELDRQIVDEIGHLSHDDLTIAALKRRKLEIKDELQKLQLTEH
jgi:hypothetical protein